MEYGNTSIRREKLYLYQGFDPAKANFPPDSNQLDIPMEVVNQRDAELYFMWQMYKITEDGTEMKKEILKQIRETAKHRSHLDESVEFIGTFLFGPKQVSSVLNSVRTPGLPLVGDWKCLKSMVKEFGKLYNITTLTYI